MHYTEGERYSEISPGVREFQDLNPSTLEKGTEIEKYFLNAVMYEIINAVEEAGLTVNANGADDEADGYQQLKRAIFSSNALTASAIALGTLTRSQIASGFDGYYVKTLTGLNSDGDSFLYTPTWKSELEITYTMRTDTAGGAGNPILTIIQGASTLVSNSGHYLSFSSMGNSCRQTLTWRFPGQLDAGSAYTLRIANFLGTVTQEIESAYAVFRRVS